MIWCKYELIKNHAEEFLLLQTNQACISAEPLKEKTLMFLNRKLHNWCCDRAVAKNRQGVQVCLRSEQRWNFALNCMDEQKQSSVQCSALLTAKGSQREKSWHRQNLHKCWRVEASHQITRVKLIHSDGFGAQLPCSAVSFSRDWLLFAFLISTLPNPLFFWKICDWGNVFHYFLQCENSVLITGECLICCDMFREERPSPLSLNVYIYSKGEK